jgi:hypothetical protein
LGIIFSPSAALPDSAVRVGCQDEDEVQAMLNVADVLSTSRGSLLFADLLSQAGGFVDERYSVNGSQ